MGVDLYPDVNVFEVAKPYARGLTVERFTPQRVARRVRREGLAVRQDGVRASVPDPRDAGAGARRADRGWVRAQGGWRSCRRSELLLERADLFVQAGAIVSLGGSRPRLRTAAWRSRGRPRRTASLGTTPRHAENGSTKPKFSARTPQSRKLALGDRGPAGDRRRLVGIGSTFAVVKLERPESNPAVDDELRACRVRAQLAGEQEQRGRRELLRSSLPAERDLPDESLALVRCQSGSQRRLDGARRKQ